MKNINRREFLKRSAAATLAATPGLSFAQSVGGGAPFNDYRALVCVFLFGGNDSFNMVVPYTQAEYNLYANSRQNLAIPRDQLLPVNPLSQPATPGNEPFGLHPVMGGLQALFASGELAFVNNVGPLIEPTTKSQYFDKSVLLPPQLFSHNDQQDQWLSLKGRNISNTGWAGRMADLIRTNVAGQQMATNASLFGSNLFQSADETFAYVMGASGPERYQWLSWFPQELQDAHYQAFGAIVDESYDSVYARGFADVQRRAIDSADSVSAAIASARDFATPFPGSQLGTQLRTVASLIDVRDQLRMQRQIFFVAAGGFDSHDNQEIDQPVLLGDVSDSIAAFAAALQEMGMRDSVTTFTQSDFGRTLTSNGDGTDHAWGGIQLVMGGSVMGQDMYGTYPLLQIDGPDDVGGGRMIPTTSADQFAATLASWFGIPDADLDIVAPNIDNFAQRDLGFMV